MLDSGDGSYAVAPEVEEALNVTEAELVADYCRWLVDREEEASTQLVEVHEVLRHRQQEVAELHAHIANLQAQQQELSLTLDRILHGNTWRLRNLAHRILRRIRAIVARPASSRSRT